MKVWPMDEGGPVIKAADLEEAKAAYADWLVREDTCGDDIADQVERATYREGWYRWTPCSQRSCYDHGNHRPGHLQTAEQGSRGAWWGVAVDYP